MSTLTVSLVSVAGRIDQAASEEAFHTALSKHIAEVEVETSGIAVEVSAFFAENLGLTMPMGAVPQMVAQRLGATHENFTVLSKRVHEYLRANSQDPKNDKSNVETSLFVIGKGPGGGIYARADRAVKPA